MAIRNILLLGNPKLHEASRPIGRDEVPSLSSTLRDLHDTLLNFRRRYGAGRAIAAPQIGVMKRLVYMNIEYPMVFINPVLEEKGAEVVTVWDDCMCFPELLVKVKRHERCRITFRNLEWKECSLLLDKDLSELLQHECDHLDGILATARVIDGTSFALKSQMKLEEISFRILG